jgi:hypothetical protein
VIVRLAAKILPETVVNVPGLGPCWPFMGARTAEGYGVIRDEAGKLAYAHRIALAAALGRPLRPGMFSNHRCDYKPCCRPSHLYEGTRSENENDKRWGSRPPRGDAMSLPMEGAA